MTKQELEDAFWKASHIANKAGRKSGRAQRAYGKAFEQALKARALAERQAARARVAMDRAQARERVSFLKLKAARGAYFDHSEARQQARAAQMAMLEAQP